MLAGVQESVDAQLEREDARCQTGTRWGTDGCRRVVVGYHYPLACQQVDVGGLYPTVVEKGYVPHTHIIGIDD